MSIDIVNDTVCNEIRDILSNIVDDKVNIRCLALLNCSIKLYPIDPCHIYVYRQSCWNTNPWNIFGTSTHA